MLILRDPALASRIADLDIRRLVQQRFDQILVGDAYDYDQHGYTIVVEVGDEVSALEEESGCQILRNLFDDARFGDTDFCPSFEILEEHDGCYEMVFVLNDDGFAVALFIPKQQGIDACLLAMCAEYAVPAM